MKSYTGIVTKGLGRASSLGFPTVNIPLTDMGARGIYVARVLVGGEHHDAAAFADPARGLLEAYILNFSDDLYGHSITIELHRKLRDRKQFTDDESLRKAIEDDIARVRLFFNT
jgi:riboflavin kinase/FMN adenylyltransferase